MPAKQTKTEPAAAPAPAPQPQPPEPYGSSGLIRVRRLLGDTSDESREFFEALMEKWEKGCCHLPEAAFAMGSRALGYKAIAVDVDNKESIENIDTVARILLQGEWLAH